MIKLKNIILELSAGDEAKKRGLKSIGFGRYVDPSTGKVVAKSENGRLVSVTPASATPQEPIDSESIRTNKKIDYWRYRIRMAQKKNLDTMKFHKKIAQLKKQLPKSSGETPAAQSPAVAPRPGITEPPELDPAAGEPIRRKNR